MQFLIIAYDYDDAFERRMQSREQHIINTKKMMESGNIVSAGALIEDDKMVGSSLFVDFDTHQYQNLQTKMNQPSYHPLLKLQQIQYFHFPSSF